MSFIQRFRLPAVLCSLIFLLCEMASRPYAEMGISDDWSYIITAQKLAETGHIIYNGWATAMVGWQLYVAAGFFKLFGVSFTTARATTLLIAMATTFVLHRTSVRLGLNERNATIATLAGVLSPIFFVLSATFMTDIPGVFAIVACFYGCLRALQTTNDRASISWLFFAVGVNAICGTSRQIAWLGVLVIVPSTLWVLRSRRKVVMAGAAATMAGAAFIYGCMRWLANQPFALPEPLFFHLNSTVLHMIVWQLIRAVLELALLLLPLLVIFLPAFRSSSRRILIALGVIAVGYGLSAWHFGTVRPNYLIQPTLGDWLVPQGYMGNFGLEGQTPILLPYSARVLLTGLTLIALLSLLASLAQRWKTPALKLASCRVTFPRKDLLILLGPFVLIYCLLLLQRTTTVLFDRYLLMLQIVALVCLTRYYQNHIHSRLPRSTFWVMGLFAAYSIACSHDFFSMYRARVEIANELSRAGIPETWVDFGWEKNWAVEVNKYGYINESRIIKPQNAYIPIRELMSQPCKDKWYGHSLHLEPRYAVSFDPNRCDGQAPFTPVRYSSWLVSQPTYLYVIKYPPPWKPEIDDAVPTKQLSPGASE